MLVAKVTFPVAVLFLASLASEARYHSHLSRVLRSSNDRSSRAWERREEQDREVQDQYFEQCRFVNAWKEHLGYVSVLAFLDPAWQYSFRQAVILELLSSRFRKSGFPDIRFFVISPLSNSKNEKSEDYLEVEAWRAIGAKHEMASFVDHEFLRGNRSEIILLQDDSRSRMWERFRASRDQVIIIDRCGMLTYHVIVPWSILFFPYVKAAILSTYEEDPCGGCDPNRTQNHEEHREKLTDEKITNEKEASSTQNKIDADVEAIWTTENPENVTLHQESLSEEGHEANTAAVSLEEISDIGRLNVSTTELSTKSTTYRYDNDAIEFDEARTEDQEDVESGGISNRTVATLEPQLLPDQAGSNPSNNSSILVNHEDRTLLLDEPATDETEETTSKGEIRDRNTRPENTFGEDAFLPLRIIMYAPHVHKNGRQMKKYTHLILKTNDPDFHGHLEDDDASSTDSWQDAEEYDLETMKTDADEENANQKYMFDEDESPGLYGEVDDYWKSYEDNDITDRNKTFNDTYDNSTISIDEYRTNVGDHMTILSPEESYSVANVTEDPNVESSTNLRNIVGSNTIKSSNVSNQVDREKERQNKLAEHYKKLLSWIDYKLSK